MINKEIQNTFIDKQINMGMSNDEDRAELDNLLEKIHILNNKSQNKNNYKCGHQQRQAM